jgi:hypothetical protein
MVFICTLRRTGTNTSYILAVFFFFLLSVVVVTAFLLMSTCALEAMGVLEADNAGMFSVITAPSLWQQ